MRFHGGKNVTLDFSTNINPLGPPKIVYDTLHRCLEIKIIEKYPDYKYTKLRKLIANFYECDEDNIIVTNGAAEALNLIIVAVKPKEVIVVEPSYGEYEDLTRVLGITYRPIYYEKKGNKFFLKIDKLKNLCRDGGKLIVITNPNNPTGTYTDRNMLLSLAHECKSLFLIDEAYAELCNKCVIDIGNNLPNNVIVVRSMTKWLAVPGLRIGFIYTCNKNLYKLIDSVRPPWNINALAACVIENVFKDVHPLKQFIDKSRKYIVLERGYVISKLKSLGIQVFESTTNFLLLHLGNSVYKVLNKLKENNIAVRECWSFKGLNNKYIRISIKRRSENNKLLKVLREALIHEKT